MYNGRFATQPHESLHPKLYDGRVGAWAPLVGPTGANLFDFAPTPKHGIITVPDWRTREGLTCLHHANPTDYVNLGTRPDINNITKMTVMFWVRLDSLVDGGRWVGKWGATTAGQSWIVTATGTAGKWLFAIYNDGYTIFETYFATLVTGRWIHICAVLSSPTSMRLYQDGVEIPTNILFAAALGGPWASSNETRFGNLADGANSFDGDWCDLSIYKREVSAEEIETAARFPGIAYKRKLILPRVANSEAIPPAANRRRIVMMGF